MAIVATFLLSLLCAIVPCDPDYGSPEIVDPQGQQGSGVTDPPVVNTTLGAIEGYFMRSTEGCLIYAFEGIPYAEPPINRLRFRRTTRKKRWDSVLPAKNIGPYCLQIHATKLFRVIGQEDCLYLNVYSTRLPGPEPFLNSRRRKTNSSRLHPVIIWIHGGSFIFGSGGEYGPAMMLNEDIVLVTVNYRLGVLGFLSTGDESSPGNFGLHDQALAIEWVHENIEAFGGHRGQILLMGQSAGGVAVHLHMISNGPTTRYFQRGMSLSGNAFDNWGLKSPKAGRALANKMAAQFECPTQDSAQLVHCLRQINPVFLVAKQLNLFDWFPFPVVLFSPTLETEGPGAFITKTAETAYANASVARIPWITSVTAQEGYTALLFTEPLMRTQVIRTKWAQLAPIVLNYGSGVNDTVTSDLTQKITSFYFRGGSPSQAPMELLSQIISDRYFNVGFHLGLKNHVKIGPTFGSMFAFKGKYGLEGVFGIPSSQWGVGHTEDVFYLFNSSAIFPGFKLRDAETEMSKIMINLIVNFSKSGTPFYTGRNLTESFWKQVEDPENMQILALNNSIKMISDPFKGHTKFWQNLELRSQN